MFGHNTLMLIKKNNNMQMHQFILETFQFKTQHLKVYTLLHNVTNLFSLFYGSFVGLVQVFFFKYFVFAKI